MASPQLINVQHKMHANVKAAMFVNSFQECLV
jgi:hypothetical protein